MRIEFVRSGGFAGLQLTANFNSEALPPDEARALEQKIKDAGFFDLPARIMPASPGPDRFEYNVTIESDQGKHTVVINETVVPERMRPLLEHLMELARSGKYR